MLVRIVLCCMVLAAVWPAQAETPEEWIALGTRLHGGFGAFIPIGIRVGLDARERIKVSERGLVVTYFNGEKAPCPCIADGVMLATDTSPGRGTLIVAADKAPPGMLALIVVRDRKTNEALRYTIADQWLAKVMEWNKTLDPAGRFDAAMKAEHVFEVIPAPGP
jgi:formylmethanofuran dehydrogenase subunit E